MNKEKQTNRTKNNQDFKRLYYVGIGIFIMTIVTQFFPGIDEAHILYLDAAWLSILVTMTGVVVAKTLGNRTDHKIKILEDKIDALTNKLDCFIEKSNLNEHDLSKKVKLDHD